MRTELSFNKEYQQYFEESAGKEHYRLLESLVAGKKGVVVDVGTLYGSSALALASNPEVQVWTYDIVNHIPKGAGVSDVPNISFRIQDGIDAVPDFIGSTDFIVLDIDPHDGIQEKRFFEALQKHGFKGTVVCDDIHLNQHMRDWWNSITLPKQDLTSQGHWSGTGLVTFN